MSTAELAIHCRTFRLPSQGHEPSECQDACAAVSRRGRFAIADGATESAGSGLWAQMLVEAFVAGDEEHACFGWLRAVQERWSTAVEPAPGAEPLPWYLQVHHAQGAFATFLGMVVQENRWHAQAVGDSCLFQVRHGAVLRAFPLTRSSQFGSTPALIGSRSSSAEVRGQCLELTGKVSPGDQLWLMTDALSCWFLTEVEAGHRPWLHLQDLIGEPDFREWVGRLRACRKLRNDDTTLVALTFQAD